MSTNRIDVIGVSGKTGVALKKAYRARQFKKIHAWVGTLSVMGPPVYFAASLMDYWATSGGLAMGLEYWMPRKFKKPQPLSYFFLLDRKDKIKPARPRPKRYWECAKLARELIEECLHEGNDWLEPICCLVVIEGITISPSDEHFENCENTLPEVYDAESPVVQTPRRRISWEEQIS